MYNCFLFVSSCLIMGKHFILISIAGKINSKDANVGEQKGYRDDMGLLDQRRQSKDQEMINIMQDKNFEGKAIFILRIRIFPFSFNFIGCLFQMKFKLNQFIVVAFFCFLFAWLFNNKKIFFCLIFLFFFL